VAFLFTYVVADDVSGEEYVAKRLGGFVLLQRLPEGTVDYNSVTAIGYRR